LRRLDRIRAEPDVTLAFRSGLAGRHDSTNICRNCIKQFGALGESATAAEKFADYWGGAGTWQDMPSERRIASHCVAEALKPNFFEWDAVMNETTPAEKWATSVYRCRGLRVALRRHGSAWMAHPLITVGGRKFHAQAVVVSPSDLAGSAEQTRIKYQLERIRHGISQRDAQTCP
jgi:hypothetical protein